MSNRFLQAQHLRKAGIELRAETGYAAPLGLATPRLLPVPQAGRDFYMRASRQQRYRRPPQALASCAGSYGFGLIVTKRRCLAEQARCGGYRRRD